MNEQPDMILAPKTSVMSGCFFLRFTVIVFETHNKKRNDTNVRYGKKTFFGIILITILLLNLFLTLQSSEGTVSLSEGLRTWLEQFGIHSDSHSIRSNAHLVVYFVLAVALILYGREVGWKWWVIILIGWGIGVVDEGIKVLLPTREFDASDLMRDFIGVMMAVGITGFIRKQLKRKSSGRQD